MELTPDDKDWTWVLERRCPDCGFDSAAMPLEQATPLLSGAVRELQAALTSPTATDRPDPATWSPLEYSCHVRDACDIFRGRIALTLAEDNPTFANWDQDETAIEQHYDRQDPATVSAELGVAMNALADQLAAIPADAWIRPALRSNGSRFSLETLVRYLVHDPIHHVYDVTGTPAN